MSVAMFRRRSDHVDGGQLSSYRKAMGSHIERIEALCDAASEIAEDLRRRTREPDEIAERLAKADEIVPAVDVPLMRRLLG